MKHVIKFWLSAAFLSIIISCGHQTKVVENNLNGAFHDALFKLSKAENPRKYVAYMVIPNTGCPGCINQAENLLKEQINTSDKIRFILTNIESLKMIKLKLGIDVKKNSRILLDTNNIFYKDTFRSIYPKIYFVNEKGEIDRTSEISPEQDGIAELKKALGKL